MRFPAFFLVALLAAPGLTSNLRAQDLAAATVVIYNQASTESAELAKFYAQKRGIARDHVVGVSCSTAEEISREEYDRTLAAPLRGLFRERRWWSFRDGPDGRPRVDASTIRFVALMKGMPLKIRGQAEAYEGDVNQGGPIGSRNDASVDSELAILGVNTRQISGAANNPYFQSYRSVTEETDPALLLVCRLDAPTAATVRRMITDAMETEKNGLWGRGFVDGAQNHANGLEIGDRWLASVVDGLRAAGIPTVYDNAPAIFPNGYPITDCALYYGWYAAGIAGAFSDADFRFLPGAVAVHIHSFSASTLRDPNANWVAPLLTKGAAVSLGNVYEPFLQLTTHLELFNDRLLHGFTFAESAYMATPALSWMTVMVGDPLYRPYAAWLRLEPKRETSKAGDLPDWKMYHNFAVQNATLPPAEYRAAARAAASKGRNAAMIEDLGGMEAREGNFAAATSYFQQARAMYAKRDDILRVVLEEAAAWIGQEKPKRALDVVRSVLRIVPNAPASALLRKVEQDLNPTPAPAATPR